MTTTTTTTQAAAATPKPPKPPPRLVLRLADDETAAGPATEAVGGVTLGADGAGALLSPCRTYRYLLVRRVSDRLFDRGVCVFVMLNPSTADESADDATVRRCVGFARSLGKRWLLVANLFALRSRSPKNLRVAPGSPDPVGPDNDRILAELCRGLSADDVLLAAWGIHGGLHGRGDAVLRLMREASPVPPQALGVTASGMPRHPLYLRADAVPVSLP